MRGRRYGIWMAVAVALGLAGSAASCSGKNGDACATPAEGCECANSGVVVACGETLSTGADSVTCLNGKRTCEGGHWGTCVGSTTSIQSFPPNYGTKGLGSTKTCVGNPCDPNCYQMVDDGSGLDAGTGLTANEAGITITAGDTAVDTAPTCTGIACNIDACAASGGPTATKITGIVFDPAGYNPLYNAVVYIPNAALDPLVEGVSCDKCVGGSGKPIVTTTTGADGTFTLQGVPNGTNIPLVIQIGKWRRKAIIPTVNKCVTNALDSDTTSQPKRDALLTRLPRTNNETSTDDHIPQMAIATGGADPFECLLLKMGIDSSEFKRPSDSPNGRVHFYKSNGFDLASGAPAASTLWSSTATLNKYDIVFLPCEGYENDKGGPAYNNAISYTTGGGRLFTTHYSYVWMQKAPSPFSTVATWNHRYAYDVQSPTTGTIDTSFTKGAAFSSWLTIVGAAAGPGQLSVSQPRWDAQSVNTAVATLWMTGTNWTPLGTYYYPLSGWGNGCATTADCPNTGDGTVAADYRCKWSWCEFGTGGNYCMGKTCASDADCGPGKGCAWDGCYLQCTDKVTSTSADMKMHFTFNTPVGAAPDTQCGRVVYSDFHVSASAIADSTADFPASCKTGTLSNQEKALEFMVFDLSSCVTPDIPPAPPPPPPPYPSAVTFTRDYDGTCGKGYKPVWRFFDYQTVTPSDSSIKFDAQTSQTSAGLAAATVVNLTTVSGAPITTWTGVDVGAKLVPTYGPTPTAASQEFLRITVTFNPSTDKMSAPTLTAWRQNYDCVPIE